MLKKLEEFILKTIQLTKLLGMQNELLIKTLDNSQLFMLTYKKDDDKERHLLSGWDFPEPKITTSYGKVLLNIIRVGG